MIGVSRMILALASTEKEEKQVVAVRKARHMGRKRAKKR